MAYHGDIHLGDTIDLQFVTTAAATGAPTTLSGSPVISAYVGNSTTQLTAGITLSVDFDGVTGLNNVRVVASGGNGYAAATNIGLVITTGTVGGTSAVGYVVGSFSIDCRGVNQILGTAVSTPATAGILDVNVKNINNVAAATPGASGGILISGSNSGTTTLAALTVTGALTVSDGVAITCSTSNRTAFASTGNGTGAGATFTSGAGATGNGINATSGATNGHGMVFTGLGTGHGASFVPGATGNGVKIIGGATSGSALNLVGTNGGASGLFISGQGSAAGMSILGGSTGHGVQISGGGTSGDGINVTTTSGHGINLAPAGTSKHGFFATGGNGGTSDGMSLAAGTGGVDLRANQTGNLTGNVSGSVGSVTGAVGSVTGDVGGNVTGSVGSVAAGGITAASVADGTIDRATFAADTGLQSIRSNTAQAGAATTITLDASASATNSFYNNCIVYLTGGTGVGQARFITAYVGSTKVATVATWATNPDNTSTFAILPFDAVAGASAPTAAQVATAVWQDSTGSDFTAASSIGKSLYTSGVVPGASGGVAIFSDTAGSVPYTGITDQGTAQSATGTTLVLRSAAAFADSELVGQTVVITGGTTGVGQARLITANVGSTDTITVDTWTTTPTGTITYKIFASAPSSATSPVTADVVKWNGTAVSTPATAGIPDVNVKNIDNDAASASGTVTFPNATLASTTNITAGTVTTATNVTTVNGLAANVITAASVADGAIDRATFAADTGLQTIRSNTAQAGAATTITLDASANANNNFYNNCIVFLTGGTGVGQARFITAYVGSTKVATVATWTTNPDNTSTFAILPFDAVAGASAPTAAQVATAVWQDATAGDFTAASSIGKSLYTSGVVPGAAGGLFIAGTNAATTITTALTTTFTGNLTGSVGSVTGAVGSVTGAVGSVTGNVGGNVVGSVGSVTGAVGSVTGAVGSVTGNVGGNVVGSVGSVTGAVGSVTGAVGSVTGSVGSIATGGIAAASFAASAIDAAALATDAVNEIADGFLNRDMSTGTDSGSPTVRTPRQALRALRNKNSATAGTVYKEDDTTASWTYTLTTDAAADPITIIDPA